MAIPTDLTATALWRKYRHLYDYTKVLRYSDGDLVMVSRTERTSAVL